MMRAIQGAFLEHAVFGGYIDDDCMHQRVRRRGIRILDDERYRIGVARYVVPGQRRRYPFAIRRILRRQARVEDERSASHVQTGDHAPRVKLVIHDVFHPRPLIDECVPNALGQFFKHRALLLDAVVRMSREPLELHSSGDDKDQNDDENQTQIGRAHV